MRLGRGICGCVYEFCIDGAFERMDVRVAGVRDANFGQPRSTADVTC